MRDKEMDIAIGGMLHDIGKILHRYNDGRNHSISGHDYIKEHTTMAQQDVLVQIKYHHSKLLRGAKIPDDSLAYITYTADNIASMADRRKKDEEGIGFSKNLPLASIFNLLNGNEDQFTYPQSTLETETPTNPSAITKEYTEDFYGKCLQNIIANINALEHTTSSINSLLEVLEANLSFIPSSTSNQEVADISLYDHVKLTAGLGCCIYQYLEGQERRNYKQELLLETASFYEEKAFLLYSIDISGIQDFIYTINSKGALKNLRARSFYLEMIMEHSVDELLEMLSLCRTNVIYSGGGHGYFLLSNTQETKDAIEEFEIKLNQWLLEHFSAALYVAGGSAECSANDLQNKPKGSYKEIFKTVSNEISNKKSARYTKQDIIKLNSGVFADGERECSVCKRRDRLNKEDKCELCTGLEKLSKMIQEKAFFSVVLDAGKDEVLPLPNGKYMIADTAQTLIQRMKTESYVRTYCKNNMYVGLSVASKIWVGDYQKENTLEKLVEQANGIERLAVLRADVDNLGQAFVSGFEREDGDGYYVTLSRTAAFSRKLSIFFKRHINYILENGIYSLDGVEKKKVRNISIVYSGGDDLFIIGAWNDVLEAALDINIALQKFTQGTLTMSGGIGLYPEKYPVVAMARDTGALEDLSKKYPQKNAITLFGEGNTYSWKELEEQVIQDKYRTIADFFVNADEKGNGLLYRLLDLMRNKEEKINKARFAYTLARLDPGEKANSEERQRYLTFAKKMYTWYRDETQCKQGIMAMYLYVYLHRKAEKE